MIGKLLKAKSVLWCKHCRIHRYVAAPFIADHDSAEKAVSMKENTQTLTIANLKSPDNQQFNISSNQMFLQKEK